MATVTLPPAFYATDFFGATWANSGNMLANDNAVATTAATLAGPILFLDTSPLTGLSGVVTAMSVLVRASGSGASPKTAASVRDFSSLEWEDNTPQALGGTLANKMLAPVYQTGPNPLTLDDLAAMPNLGVVVGFLDGSGYSLDYAEVTLTYSLPASGFGPLIGMQRNYLVRP